MRTLRRNEQKMQYATFIGKVPKYQLDSNGNKVVDFVDESGTTFYRTTGSEEMLYADPIEFFANISLGGGESAPVEFGIDASAYDASVVYDLNKYPITETTLIWYTSQPVFIGTGDDRHVDPKSADFTVTKVKPSLNYTKLLLGKVVK